MTATPHVRARVSFFKEEEDMGRRRGQRSGHLREHHGSWLLTYRVYDVSGKSQRETVTIGPADGPGKFTEKQAERVAWDHYLSKVDQVAQAPRTLMKVSEFWEQKYKPSALMKLKKGTREQYFSLYANWIGPVIGNKRLATLESSDIESCVTRCLEAGMSSATAKAIRKVSSAIFTKAKKMKIASGDNPASLAEIPEAKPVREKVALTVPQMRNVLDLLTEPVRTMALTAVLTSMNVAELCGLRWRHVNLSPEWVTFNGEGLAPFTIAVRQHFSRGEVGSLKTGTRKRNIPMPESLVEALAKLKARHAYVGLDDVVFCSRRGTPISGNNVGKRILSKMAETIGVSRLGWHNFRYTHATLTQAVGMNSRDRQDLMGHGALEMTQRYTAQDSARLRSGLEQVAGLLQSKVVVQ